jgi:hypothetical protein
MGLTFHIKHLKKSPTPLPLFGGHLTYMNLSSEKQEESYTYPFRGKKNL